MTKVLFLHGNTPDYLSAGLFHGLRSLLGANCVDLPRFDCAYAPLSTAVKSKIRGNGFTLYGLLKDIPDVLEAQRFFIWHKNIHDYDYYVIADIWNCWEQWLKLRQLVPAEKIIIIDPSDSIRGYPYNNFRTNFFGILTNSFLYHARRSPYYKREHSGTLKGFTGIKFIPDFLLRLFTPSKILPISFSVPAEKITKVDSTTKTKTFAENIVDQDLKSKLNTMSFTPLGKEVYKFNDETLYYKDIQQSKFGITTKRSGWDCLRHYEFAANGTVLCFKNLEQKPPTSAPYGLDNSNCISYSNYDELMSKVGGLSEVGYNSLLQNSNNWINQYTTKAVAQRFLNSLSNFR